jgi:hypothetical protein
LASKTNSIHHAIEHMPDYMWKGATDVERTDFYSQVLCHDLAAVKDWIHNQRVKQTGHKTHADLVKEAKELGIKNWCRMTNIELVRAITQEQRRRDTK